MKKRIGIAQFAALAFAFVFLIAGAAVGKREDVHVGAGNGTAESVAEIGDLSDLLACIADADRRMVPVAAVSGSKQYTSMTMHESTTTSIDLDFSNRLGKSHSKVSMQRELSMYVSEDAVYYKADAKIYSYSKAEPLEEDMIESNVYTGFGIDIYLSAERVLLRFDSYAQVRDGEALTGMERVLGRWVDLSGNEARGAAAEKLLAMTRHATLAESEVSGSESDEAAQMLMEGLLSITSYNFDVLSVFGKYIEDRDCFQQEGDLYTLQKESFLAMTAELLSANGTDGSYLSEDCDGGMSVDLSSPKAPSILFRIGEEYTQKEDETTLGGFTVSYQPYVRLAYSEEDRIGFENINNTAISLPALSTMPFNEFAQNMEKIFQEVQ